MELYLRELARTLRLDGEETRAIVAEVRDNLQDLVLHLRGQGYSPDEAEQEALRRFDDAAGLARALHRAHRRAPLALQSLAALLVVAGVAGFLLGFDMFATATVAGLHTEVTTLYASGAAIFGAIVHALPWGADKAAIGTGLMLMLAPSLAVLAGAAASLWVASAILLGRRRPRWRRLGALTGAVLLCDALLTAIVISTVPNPAPMAIPEQARLAAAGLCFRPSPYLAPSPLIVDRLCADRAATYVQYHIPDAPSFGDPFPVLYDQRSHYLFGITPYPLVSCRPCSGFTGAQGSGTLRHFTPWRPVEQGLAQFAPLDAGAHTAVLRIGNGAEIVRIPLRLASLKRLGGGAHPFIVVRAHGVTINLVRVLRGLSTSVLDLTIDATPAVLARMQLLGPGAVTLADARGRDVPLLSAPSLNLTSPYPDGCEQVERGGGHCAPERLFAPLPRGTRLTLTVQSVVIQHGMGRNAGGRTVAGPWRITFTMP